VSERTVRRRGSAVPAPPLHLVLALVGGQSDAFVDAGHVVRVQLTDAHLILRQLHSRRTLLARRVRLSVVVDVVHPAAESQGCLLPAVQTWANYNVVFKEKEGLLCPAPNRRGH